VATNYRKIIASVTIEERIVRIKGVRNRGAHFDFRWQRTPRKYCGSHVGTTQAVSIESVSLRTVGSYYAKRGARLEAIGSIGYGPALCLAVALLLSRLLTQNIKFFFRQDAMFQRYICMQI